MAISRDSLDRERRGRVIGEDQYKGAIRARTRELMRLDTGRPGGGHRVPGGAPGGGSGEVGRGYQAPGAAPGAGARSGGARGGLAPGGGGRSGRGPGGHQAPGTAPGAAARLAGGRATSSETVLKVVSWTKDSASPMAQARYASRTRQSDPAGVGLPMINEEGRELRGVQIEAEIRSWNLKSEAENLSAAARRATPEERRDMEAAKRLDRNQAVHMIFSVPAHAKADAERLGRAVDLALRETVGEGGFRYVYTIHTDHSARPHAHVVIKARSEPFVRGSENVTRQLRLRPRELDAMRQVFTRHAQEQGLNVVATRRQDREHMRADILAGQAPLRENKKFHQAMKQTRQGRTFELKAPSWYEQHGLDYERRRLSSVSVGPAGKPPATGQTAGEGRGSTQTGHEKPARGFLGRLVGRVVGNGAGSSPPPGGPQPAPTAGGKRGGYFQNFDNYRNGASPTEAKSPAEAKVVAHFAATHREPDKAVASFRAMLKEAPRLALWAAEKHPQAFGEPSGRQGPGIVWKDVRPLVDTAAREPASA
jgi:hypothetical protein